MDTISELHDWAYRIPKIDLHRHLEGSLRLSTLGDIAQEHGIELPSYDLETLRPYVQMTNDTPDFHTFLGKFKLLRHFYTSKQAVQRIVHEAIADAAQDNIRYLELRFNPVALSRVQNFALDEVTTWVIEATAQAQTELEIRTCLILQIGREEPLEIAEAIVDIAIANYGPLVRGIDLAGDEANYPAERFAAPFTRAYEAGLGITVHAGEAAGATSIYAAINDLHAMRIGHGIRAVEDSIIIDALYRRNISLEVCPTSNLQTGVVPGVSVHPLIDLLNLRLRVTINTDDPSISATTLTDEYIVAVEKIGLKREQLFAVLRNGIEAAFIPETERSQLRERFRQELTAFPGSTAFDTAG